MEEEYTCEDAKKDIDSYFLVNNLSKEEKDKIAFRMIDHMVVAENVGNHRVNCQDCWYYYEEMKRKYCGG